jgi:hypothetical protein
MAAIFEDCSVCLQQELKACAETYTIDLGLDAETTYKLRIEAIDDNVYEQEITTDEDGVLEFESVDYPTGLFNQYAGTFILKIFGENECIAETFCNNENACIAVSFRDNVLKTEIKCCD